MNDLNKRALIGLARLVIIVSAALFLAAGTFHYWQGWSFLAVFSLSSLASTLYLMKYDPALLERRMKAGPRAEKEKTQKIIMTFITMCFLITFIFPPLDYRFGWSVMPASASITGDGLVALGFLIIFFVYRENTFTSAVIEIGENHKVISTGPYAWVRHPMYCGGLIIMLGVPVALGSWWGTIMIVPVFLLLAWRLLDEEKFLVKNLPGYSEYKAKVRYRLMPFVW